MVNPLLAQAGRLDVAAAVEHPEAVALFQHPDFIGGRGRGNDVVVIGETDDVFHNALASAVAVPPINESEMADARAPLLLCSVGATRSHCAACLFGIALAVVFGQHNKLFGPIPDADHFFSSLRG